MSFSLSVYGHMSDSQREKDLASQLGNLLHGFGGEISSASFSGSSFSGDPRQLVAELSSNGDPALQGATAGHVVTEETVAEGEPVETEGTVPAEQEQEPADEADEEEPELTYEEDEEPSKEDQ